MNYQEIESKAREIAKAEGMNAAEWLAYGDTDRYPDFPKFEVVHEVGDCEGGGDYSEQVLHFADANVFVKITGFYSSYNGTDWNDEIKQVFPKEKTITVYEPM